MNNKLCILKIILVTIIILMYLKKMKLQIVDEQFILNHKVYLYFKIPLFEILIIILIINKTIIEI